MDRLGDLLPRVLRAMGAPQEVLDRCAEEAHNRPIDRAAITDPKDAP
jgi:hypothetical protein